jgi:hypothetical protein
MVDVGQPILNRLLHRTPRRRLTNADTLGTYRSNTHIEKGTDNSMIATVIVGEVQQTHKVATS